MKKSNQTWKGKLKYFLFDGKQYLDDKQTYPSGFCYRYQDKVLREQRKAPI